MRVSRHIGLIRASIQSAAPVNHLPIGQVIDEVLYLSELIWIQIDKYHADPTHLESTERNPAVFGSLKNFFAINFFC